MEEDDDVEVILIPHTTHMEFSMAGWVHGGCCCFFSAESGVEAEEEEEEEEDDGGGLRRRDILTLCYYCKLL